ncbi:MAG: cysteine protease StiP family protein [Oscillospiraceae bacterium]|nr:cysteine protease StiP family protein [Oscillospiraceae bacterium]
MKTSYHKEDVIILLKDITGLVTPLPAKEREIFIQNGTHYCEMLPLEYEPSEKYFKAYCDALKRYSKITADAVRTVSEKIYFEKKNNITLVSLARAGTSIGVLIKHYIELKYKINVPHYTISIIRGRGIDKNAMNFILKNHTPDSIQFIDGWTGKGAIQRQLSEAIKDYPEVSSGLAVLSDPANIAEKCGTHDDFLIASSCLNSTVSGLMSRTFLRNDIISANDFHGAMYYKELENKDLTYQFIDTIEKDFDFSDYDLKDENKNNLRNGLEEVVEISDKFNIKDINLIKPSIGEATRVLLRRVPYKMLVHSLDDYEHLGHIYQLAKEKNVELEVYPLRNYKACGLIKNMADN